MKVSHRTQERVARNDMKEVGSPMQIWDLLCFKRARKWSVISKNILQLSVSNLREELIGEKDGVISISIINY